MFAFFFLLRKGNSVEAVNTSASWQNYLQCGRHNRKGRFRSLYRCMKEVARFHEQSMLSQLAHENGPRSLLIGLVTVVTSDILPYAAYGIAVNLFYAIHNQYIFHIVDLSDDHNMREKEVDWDRYDVRWNKVKALSHAFSDSAADCDYLLWVDADLILLDMNFKMEELIRLYPQAHLIASAGNDDDLIVVYTLQLLDNLIV